MKSVRRKRYTAEFKAQAVELASLGKPVKEVAEDLGVGVSLLYGWIEKASRSSLPQGSGVQAEGVESETEEVRTLRREVANLRLENNILKKAAVILGTNPP